MATGNGYSSYSAEAVAEYVAEFSSITCIRLFFASDLRHTQCEPHCGSCGSTFTQYSMGCRPIHVERVPRDARVGEF